MAMALLVARPDCESNRDGNEDETYTANDNEGDTDPVGGFRSAVSIPVDEPYSASDTSCRCWRRKKNREDSD